MIKSMRVCAAIAPFLLASAAHADGTNSGDGVLVGAPLTAAEKAAVNAAIAKLQTLTNAETNAQNKATMQRVIDCLKDMLKNGQIGRETGTNKDEAVTYQDGLCSCKADTMNINADSLVGGEPACSNLADSIMHEGIHTIQWDQPGSMYGGTEAKEEWVAYSWGKYVLEKLLMNPDLTPEQKAALKDKLEGDCEYRDDFCATATTQNADDAKKAGAERKRSAAVPTHLYESTYPNSGRVRIENEPTGAALRTLDTSFPLRSGLAVFLNASGREVIFVGGTDPAAITGALVTFADTDGDGLVDQASRTVQTLAGGAVPLSLVEAGSTLWVLARAPGGSDTSLLYSIPDVSGDGVPDLSAAVLFASGATMPALNSVRTFRVDSPSQVVGSPRQHGMRVVNSLLTYSTFLDSNNDHVADTFTTTPFDSLVLPFIPTPIQAMNAPDSAVVVRAHPTAIVQVLHTDELGNTLELLGASPGASGMTRSITLSRPLNPGEYIELLDQNHAMRSPAPFLVGPPTPEILAINQTEVLPGQTVQLTTRSVDPTTVTVRCSGIPATVGIATPTLVVFIAPTVGELPPGVVEVELVQLSLQSNPVGLLIDGDCNHNGIADTQDVTSGSSADVNLDSIPDECQCMADFDRDGVVRVLDIFAFLDAWFAGDPTTRFGGPPSVQNIFTFLNVWFAGCHT